MSKSETKQALLKMKTQKEDLKTDAEILARTFQIFSTFE